MRAAAPVLCAVILTVFPGSTPASETAEQGYASRVHVSLMGGFILYEGDEAVDVTAGLGALALGYDLTEHLTVQTVLEFTPELDDNVRIDPATGEEVSRLSEAVGRKVTSTDAGRVSVEALWHLAPDKRIDPYLAAGAGVAIYGEDFDQQVEPVLRAGAGVFRHVTDRLALRGDVRVVMAGDDAEFNAIGTLGLMWSFGAPAGTAAPAMEAPAPEPRASTPTEPAAHAAPQPAPPRAAAQAEPEDTGVKLYELHMHFDPGKAILKPEYYSGLDVIGRLLREEPKATARIEGHVDEEKGVAEAALRKLSLQRAEAVRGYLVTNWKLESSRLEAVGMGAARPKDQPGPEGNQRIEVYVSGL